MTNNSLLKQLVREYGITHKMVAMITGKSLSLVNRWFLHEHCSQYSPIKESDLNKVAQLTQCIEELRREHQ